MIPVFIDIASWCDERPLVAREIAAVALGWQNGTDDFRVEVVVPADAHGKLCDCGYDAKSCLVSKEPMHEIVKIAERISPPNPFGDPSKDLRLVGWDINSKVWPLLDVNMMREGCSLFRFRCSIWKKWNDNRFGDLRNLLTQGFYCAKDDDIPFDDFVEILYGNRLPSFDSAAEAGRYNPRARGALVDIMAPRIMAMADLYEKHGGTYNG